jgi:hypothetical protein
VFVVCRLPDLESDSFQAENMVAILVGPASSGANLSILFVTQAQSEADT